MANRLKLNAELSDAICSNLACGVSMEAAAEAAGVPRSTFFSWLKRGREEGSDAVYVQFAADIEAAQAIAENRLIRLIGRAATEGGPGDWRAAAWLLSRRHPERWSEKRQLEVSTAERPSSTQAVAAMFAQVQAHLGVQSEEEASDDQ